MRMYYELSEFEKGHQLSYPLSIIKSSIQRCQKALADWVRYESEGYLDSIEAIVLTIKVSIPSKSPFGILKEERIAVCFSNHKIPLLKACALRIDFPDLPHLNLTPKNKPKEICLFDVQFMDHMYNQSFMDFIRRIKEWLDRAAIGELHLDEQPMEPLLMSSKGDLVLDKETYERIVNGDSGFELFPTHYYKPEKNTPRYYIEVSSRKRPDPESKNPFAVLCIKSRPSSDQCINHRPENYLDLYDLLRDKLDIDLDKEIHSFIKKFYKTKDGAKRYLHKYLIVAICIPRLNSKGQETIPEIVVFHLDKKLSEIGTSIGCLKEKIKSKEKKTIYILQDEFHRRSDKLKDVKVSPFKVIRPFTKELAMKMADIPESLTDNSITVIGQGALGSQLVLNLARQGFSNWRLVDDDILLPHNFARHGLSALYRGWSKAYSLKSEIDLILDKSNVKAYPAYFKDLHDINIQKAIDTDLILDCSGSYSVLLELAYRDKPNSRTFSTYYGGRGYTSVLLCEDIERTVRLDDLDLQLKVKGLDSPICRTIYKVREERQIVYSTSCNNTTTVIAQDLVAIHSGVLTQQIKRSLERKSAQIFVNLIHEDGMGVQVETFVPSKVITQNTDGWQFRINQHALDDMNKFRELNLPNETGGVLIGWINSFRKIIYVGKALPAPPDSEERPYYFQRGQKGLYEIVNQISDITNGDLYYVGEWHSHPPSSSVAQSYDDVQSMKKISELMLEDSLPGIMIIIGDSYEIGCYIDCGWENDS